MAFTVEHFQDLVRLLEERPEWQAQLRRLLLPNELLDLPSVVRQLVEQVRMLAEAQRRTEARLEQLADAQARTETRVEELVVAQTRTEARLEVLAEAQARTEIQVGKLAEAQAQTVTELARLRDQVAEVRGHFLEQRYRDHASGYFGRVLRRARAIGPDELDQILDEAVAAGTLDEDAVHDVRLADLIVRGRRPDDDRETYLVVDVSAVVDASDVNRAARRASLLGQLRPALAAVAGGSLTSEAVSLARSLSVWRVENGRIRPPTEA